MADYKRMISYIYNYENGVKKNNVGYARIEVKGARCKVTVHVKAPSIQKALKVCLFFRKEEAVYCVALGEMEVRNAVGEFQGVTDADDLMETSYAFEKMTGLLLYESKDKFFGSEWDDRPIVLPDVHFIGKNGDKGAAPSLELAPVMETTRPSPEARPLDGGMGGEAQAPEEVSDKVAVSEAGKEGDGEAEEAFGEEGRMEKEADGEAFAKQLQAAEFATKMRSIHKNVTKNAKPKGRGAGGGRQIRKNAKEVDFAEYLLEEYPKMYPFEDDEVAGCVRIEPQDIGMFPMELWSLANNSFLLQGYFSYRHLVFVQTKTDGQPAYLLGVPGIYHNREEFMARMFGFHLFKTVKKKENKRGEFGYWFVHVKIPKK